MDITKEIIRKKKKRRYNRKRRRSRYDIKKIWNKSDRNNAK